MPITAKSILSQVARDLNDETSIRWTTGDLVAYFNDGQRDILTHRPDACNIAADFTTQLGAKQVLPANGEKLIRVLHNNTATCKTSITRVSLDLLDSQIGRISVGGVRTGWRGLPPVSEVLHFCYDEMEPKAFDLYPPPQGGLIVAIEYAAVTTDIPTPAAGTTTNDITGNLSLSDLFANAIRNYVMFRCYSKNTEYTANPNLAVAFYGAYANDLGIEANGTAAVSPNARP